MGFFKKNSREVLEVVNRQLRGVANEPRRQWRWGFAADDAGKTGKDSSAAETVRFGVGEQGIDAIPTDERLRSSGADLGFVEAQQNPL